MSTCQPITTETEKPDRARFHIKATLVRAYLSKGSQYSVLTKTPSPSADKQATTNKQRNGDPMGAASHPPALLLSLGEPGKPGLRAPLPPIRGRERQLRDPARADFQTSPNPSSGPTGRQRADTRQQGAVKRAHAKAKHHREDRCSGYVAEHPGSEDVPGTQQQAAWHQHPPVSHQHLRIPRHPLSRSLQADSKLIPGL